MLLSKETVYPDETTTSVKIETSFSYDDMGRRNQTTSPGGTITFQVFENRGLVRSVYMGTNATGASQLDPTGGGASASNNMVILTRNQYDGGAADSESEITEPRPTMPGKNGFHGRLL